MDQIKRLLVSGLERTISKMSSSQGRFRKFYIQQKDNVLGRDRVGVDKFGNKYYQYYSYHGLPTKRVVLYQFYDTNCFHQDPHFIGWLRRNEILPPTPEELERRYLEHDAFVSRGIAWDEEQQAIIDEFKNKRKELDEKYDRQQMISESGQPDSWVPGTKAEEPQPKKPEDEEALDETSLSIISEIDQMEQTYLSEYEKLYAKDKSENKDLNKLALEELKKAQYFFAYLRSSERLYNVARKKQKEEENGIQQKEDQQSDDGRTKEEKVRDKILTGHDDVGVGFANVTLGKSRAFKPREVRQSDRYKKFQEEFKDVFEIAYEARKDKE